MNEQYRARFSIVIGLASTEGRRQISECLSALRAQRGGHAYEVIIADRRNDDISREIAASFPEVTLVPCAPGTSLPQLRTIALHRASGEFILVTEDHCVPDVDWLSGVADTFARAPSSTAAVGGCIENGLTMKSWDWATFLCEYSEFTRPVPEGITAKLPGVNTAYRRSALAELDEKVLIAGFWESTLHPMLLRRGYTFFASNDILVHHMKSFSLRLFVTQRFSYSRYYAGLRFRPQQRHWRLAAACASVLIPPLVFSRIVFNTVGKRRLHRELFRSTPWLVLLTLVWGVGEAWGYLFGAGRALAEIE